MPTYGGMTRLALVLAVGVLAGCAGSDGEAEPQTTTDATVTTTTEEGADTGREAPPRSYDEFISRLPPFDVPASPEVTAYREATIGQFFDRCVNYRPTDLKARFVKANRALLNRVGAFPGARRVTEYSSDHRDGNGCLEGMGPPTSYSTDRMFELPKGARGPQVVEYYAGRLAGWTPAFARGGCEQTFSRGEARLYVEACAEQRGSRVVPGSLRLNATALEDETPPAPPRAPPRPYGAQYPIAANYLESPEPTAYETEPGETCERTSGSDVPSIIVPPPPGIRAELRNERLQLGSATFDRFVLVEWSFDKILGDCPPTQLHLTLVNPAEGMSPLSLPSDVRTRSGTERIPVIDPFRDVISLRAAVESVDGTRSRSVAVLIRR
jgi:hypothetical protein